MLYSKGLKLDWKISVGELPPPPNIPVPPKPLPLPSPSPEPSPRHHRHPHHLLSSTCTGPTVTVSSSTHLRHQSHHRTPVPVISTHQLPHRHQCLHRLLSTSSHRTAYCWVCSLLQPHQYPVISVTIGICS